MRLVESGPAAGALAGSWFARRLGEDRLLCFDMGGTTAKACLIEDGVPLERPGGEVGAGVTMTTRLFGGGGHVLRVPWLDIVEVNGWCVKPPGEFCGERANWLRT